MNELKSSAGVLQLVDVEVKSQDDCLFVFENYSMLMNQIQERFPNSIMHLSVQDFDDVLATSCILYGTIKPVKSDSNEYYFVVSPFLNHIKKTSYNT